MLLKVGPEEEERALMVGLPMEFPLSGEEAGVKGSDEQEGVACNGRRGDEVEKSDEFEC